MRNPRRFLTAALAAILLGGGMALATVTPAQAHDQLLASSPEANSALAESPAEITLTFSGELLSGMQSAIVEVITPDGQNIATDALSEDGTSITQPLTADPGAGVFTVRWKVVSSDGHPISGEYTYTVEADTSGIITPAPTSTPVPTTTAEATPSPSPTDTEATTTNDNEYGGETSGGGSSFAILVAVGGVIVVGGALIVVLMLGRERRRRDRADAERAASTDAAGKDSADGS